MTTLITLLTAILFGYSRAIQGGDKQIGSFYFKSHPTAGALPGAHIIATVLAALSFALWCFAVGIVAIKLAAIATIFIGAWCLTFQPPVQAYFSVGASVSNTRRYDIVWIEKVLTKLYGAPPVDYSTVSKTKRVLRDGTGFFLRNMYALPGFLALSLLYHFNTIGAIIALGTSMGFALSAVIIYGLYNWVYPKSLLGDDKLNPSEIALGVSFGIFLLSLTLN